MDCFVASFEVGYSRLRIVLLAMTAHPQLLGLKGQRLLRIGTFMSSIFNSRTSSGTAQARFGSTLILK